MNTQKFNQILETAKAKAANDPKWMRAIEKAAAGILSGEICVTLFCDGYALVTTATGQHRVNGVCSCTAARHGHTQCVHRAAKRLVEMTEETAPAAVSTPADVYCGCCGAPAPEEWDTCPSCGVEGEWMTEEEFFEDDVAASPRQHLIIEIQAAWPKTWPPLAVELMARFRCNDLNFLDDDQLRRVRLAIAM